MKATQRFTLQRRGRRGSGVLPDPPTQAWLERLVTRRGAKRPQKKRMNVSKAWETFQLGTRKVTFILKLVLTRDEDNIHAIQCLCRSSLQSFIYFLCPWPEHSNIQECCCKLTQMLARQKPSFRLHAVGVKVSVTSTWLWVVHGEAKWLSLV